MWYNAAVTMLECVPNVSEGRDRAAIGRMADAVRVTPGVRLLDVHSDPTHHRAVFTFAGTAGALERAVLQLCAEAVRTIDLTRHAGVHPRLGALDVVPFVPLGDTPMAAAVAAAHATGRALAARFGLPVLFYEHAATAAHRRPLEEVRRGGFDALAGRLATAAWQPDAGPATPHPTAGAVAVGARPLLVAFNVQLATTDVRAAKTIAGIVRARGGGMPGVKALGLPLPHRGLVQVSMNLTDLTRTRPIDVFARVSEEAARLGIAVADCELVGLAPAAAMTPAEAAAMRVLDWSPARVLETCLDARAVSVGAWPQSASRRDGAMPNARIFL